MRLLAAAWRAETSQAILVHPVFLQQGQPLFLWLLTEQKNKTLAEIYRALEQRTADIFSWIVLKKGKQVHSWSDLAIKPSFLIPAVTLLQCNYIVYYCILLQKHYYYIILLIITWLLHDYYIIITSLLCSLLLHYHYEFMTLLCVITLNFIMYCYIFIIMYYYNITSSLQMGNHVIMIPLVWVMQRKSIYYYPIIMSLLHLVLLLPIITYFSLLKKQMTLWHMGFPWACDLYISQHCDSNASQLLGLASTLTLQWCHRTSHRCRNGMPCHPIAKFQATLWIRATSFKYIILDWIFYRA